MQDNMGSLQEPAEIATEALSGYTLPVFACAAAMAALTWLQTGQTLAEVNLRLIKPDITAMIPIEQVAGLVAGMALAITRSAPGANLDLTRGTPIWALVTWGEDTQMEQIRIEGGEGIGKILNQGGQAAIYHYAETLLQANLGQQLQAQEKIRVTIILPAGRALAERTANAAFGVVEGLSLLGTSGISQPLSAPEHLEGLRQQLRQQAAVGTPAFPLVFCIGENGLDLAQRMGIAPDRLVKTANWLGPLLAEAGIQGVQSLLLLGYHGKLLKLAGGIFHTHHHLADGRREILTAFAAQLGLPAAALNVIFNSATAEAALQHLRDLDAQTGSTWVVNLYDSLTTAIDQRATAYIHAQTQAQVAVGSILFDRSRQVIARSAIGADLLQALLQS
jgi:cobalt-precorrin-5B (C1)-methyltransferase